MGSKRFSAWAVLLCVVGAIIAFALGELVLLFGSSLPEPVKMGLYFGIGAMAISAMVLISQKISPELIGYRWKEQYFKTSLKLFIPATLLMVGILAGIFQLVYSLDLHKEKKIQDIVIAIDTSGSMETTDPNKERFGAISSLIDNLKGDKRVAIMVFNDEPELVLDFMPAKTDSEKEVLKSQIAQLKIEEQGQTGITKAINQGYTLLSGSGERGSLILVSDGAPTDGSESNIAALVQQYVVKEMPIYTIGMMYNIADSDDYLGEIAHLTGGSYYNTSDVTMLKEAFGHISYNEEKGMLMTQRSGIYVASGFYRLLRILSLVVIALFIAIGIGILFDNVYLVKGMVIGSLIGGILGSLFLEFTMAGDTLPIFARLGYWIWLGMGLMSFTWCITFKEKQRRAREA